MPSLYKMLACIALGAVVGGGAASYAAVETGLLHERVLDELERKLDDQFVGDFDARRLTGTLFWGFAAHDVEIRDGSGEPVAHIDELQVDASAFELLNGNLLFDRARFIRPVVFVDRYTDGENNVDEVFKSRNSSGKSRPAGQVLFEMTRAKVVDGLLVYVDSNQPRPLSALVAPADLTEAIVEAGADGKLDSEPGRAFLARDLQAEGNFRVLSGKRTQTRFDRLDTVVISNPSAQPRRVRIKGARIDTDATSCSLGADEIAFADGWLVEGFHYRRPRGRYASKLGPIRPTELRGLATSPDGGWLQLEGRLDRRDDSYGFAIEAEDFKPADWPGAPAWSWLVLDGAGTVAGRGRTLEEIDVTVRWAARDVDVAGERLEELRLTAHLDGGRVDVEALDVKSAGVSASANGHVTEGGAFDIDVETNAAGSAAKRLAGRLGIELEAVGLVELSTQATGALDLSERAAAKLVSQLDADTTWKVAAITHGDVRWKVAGGLLSIGLPSSARVDTNVDRSEDVRRRFDFEASAAFHRLQYGAVAADVLRTTISGSGIINGGAGLDGLSYQLEVNGDRLSMGEHRATRARLMIDGALSPAGEEGKWPVESLAAQGSLDLIEYSHPAISARRLATNIDINGPFPVGQGKVVAHMTGLRTNERRFRAAEVDVRLLGGQKFRIKSKARVELSLIPDLPMYLEMSGRHGRDLKAFSVESFSLGRPGMRWKIREPGLVKFEDSAVVLQSLSLHRRSQRVSLDGAFGDAQTGSVSAIAARLKNAQVRSFFDFLPFLKSRPPLLEKAR